MTDRHLDKTTSSGMKMSDVPEHSRKHVVWIDGMDGPAKQQLPTEEEVPTPACLKMDGDERVRFPGWMTGSKAMMDAAGANSWLKGQRPGAWLISSYAELQWAVWPDGSVDQVPEDIELPASLRVLTGDECEALRDEQIIAAASQGPGMTQKEAMARLRQLSRRRHHGA